ncbi:PREDICTED: vesicle-associated protein 2-2-like [Camelina sativa]|uniref:Vesicle-associated protein 2-2-like n=1 Tax=Camelina sativa TaxID=90675 RepID=A0ABM0VYY5_CAMSA|nr:PREDICTED: vesicle-associated protein 2-2-like [Camelina sativa]
MVKDIEEMKLKVDALESNLKQADSTILKLMEEWSISSKHRQSLQHELAELRTKKIVKEVHIGFPLLYVCIVAFINIVIGYCVHLTAGFGCRYIISIKCAVEHIDEEGKEIS